MTLPLTPWTADDFADALAMISDAFGEHPHPADSAVERSVIDPGRFLLARDAGEVVATSGAFALRMTVPGGSVPIAGVSWVGVRGTHRRRGLLTAMMDRLLADAHERGEPVAALWASEAAIYQRFGYGPASWQLSLALPRGAALTRDVAPARLRRVAPTADALRRAYDALAASTPGALVRDDAWWGSRLHDPEHSRGGASPLRCVVTEDGAGYALYATKPGRSDPLPSGEVQVRELVAGTPEAHAQLWRYLLDVDLTSSTTARTAADDPLLQLLAEPRGAAARLADALWLRPVDVGAALGARTYAAPLDAVLDVRDRTCPWNAGRWRLSADASGATCARTTDAADLALDAADLGAAYLGGTPLRSRPVQELRPGALAAASTAFGPVGHGPWTAMGF